MKKISLMIMSVLLVGAMVVPRGVLAQTDEQTTDTEQDTTAQQRIERARDALQERSNAAREAVKERIDAAKAKRVANACEASLKKLTAHKNRVVTFKENHTGHYDKLKTRLETLITRLDDQTIDTSQLTADLAQLDVMVSQAKADFTTYEVLLDSAIAYDCVNDAEGFYSLIEDLRVAHSVVADELASIKDFIRKTIIADVNAIKDQLKAADTTTDAESSEATTDEQPTDAASSGA